jgi:hypothetical protein
MKRKKHYEPNVLNTPIIMLALSDEFKRATEKKGLKTEKRKK